MNDKNRQRHIAYEVLVILGQLALLTYITRLWPILLLVILGIFVAALRLLFLSSQKVEPVRPLPTLSPPRQPPTEKDLQSAAYTIIQCRVTQILRAKFPEVRWVWENPRAMEDILAGNPTSGTMGPIYRAAVGRRVRVIVPVGVEKRVEQPIHELCQIVKCAQASGLRLAPSVGMAYTELDAIRNLTGANPHLIAAGGVCGCEGSAFFQCEGTGEQLEKLEYWLHQVSSTPRFSFANCK